MTLNIDTHNKKIITLSLNSITKEIKADFNHIEILLKEIKKFLSENNLKINQIKKITATQKGDSFTALRLGITTANALNFAIGNKEKIILPKYNSEPNIG